MKILEAQSAVLTNYEVYQHLVDQSAARRARPGRGKKRGPPNFETVVREVSDLGLSLYKTSSQNYSIPTSLYAIHLHDI
jgi:hypothetical protein